ncbi:MAG: hypothetical protein AB7H90_01305 [Alphaproteobacteria bacterium]
MTDYIRNPVFIREVQGLAVEQDMDNALVNGRPASMTSGRTILDNPKHYLRQTLASIMPKIESGEIAAVVHAEVNGKPGYITISREQYALGAAERARYAAWQAECCDAEKTRQKAERAFDRGMNEGGEGYNPHRYGSRRTYR